MSVEIKVNIRGLDAVTKRLKAASFEHVPDELFDLIGQTIENQIKERIHVEKQSPQGKEWEPLRRDPITWGKSRYQEWKERRSSGGLLELYGHLLQSIQHLVTYDTIEIGSNLVYAATHQEGRGKIPARPYLGISDENEDRIDRVMERWYARVVGS